MPVGVSIYSTGVSLGVGSRPIGGGRRHPWRLWLGGRATGWPVILLAVVRITAIKLVVGVVVAALVAAAPAAAKEGAKAHLLAALPTRAMPGTFVTIRWRVDVPGPNGKRIPFSAIGMFVRLVGSGGASTTATAPQLEGPPYSVRIRVPRGGIRHVRFGLEGTSCGPAGCSPSPAFFPLK